MTEGEFFVAFDYWVERLHLEHWKTTVKVVEKPFGFDGALASACPNRHYEDCDFEFKEDLLNRSDVEVNQTIVHELLHAIFRDMETTTSHIQDHISSGIWELFHDNVLHAQEQLIDKLATILVEIDAP